MACGEVKMGDSVRYRQRRDIVRGFTRASATEQQVIHEEAETGEIVTVLLVEVEPLDDERPG